MEHHEEDGVSRDAGSSNDGVFFEKGWPMRSVVGIVCVLSIIGSLVIILSYSFKDLRTRARWILLHLSVMDLGVALSNLTGDVVNFDKYYYNNETQMPSTEWQPSHVPTPIHVLCVTQAFLALYFTLGAVLWTGCLAVYMYFLILYRDTGSTMNSKVYFYFTYLFTYGVPLIIALWLVFTHRLGYAPYDSSGWCSVISKKPSGEADVYGTVFGYDLWVFGTSFLTMVVYLSVHFYLRDYRRQMRAVNTQARQAMQNVDYKFIAIPLVFILLRVWTQITNIILIYSGQKTIPGPQGVTITLLYLSGIGDSGQGFANAVLFVAFTKSVRTKFKRLLRGCLSARKNRSISQEGVWQNYYSITLPSDSEMTVSCESTSGTGHQSSQYVPSGYQSTQYAPSVSTSHIQQSCTTQGTCGTSYPVAYTTED